MQLGITGNIDSEEGVSSPNNLLFLGFHGYGNDESEMVRIINAICGTNDADSANGTNSYGTSAPDDNTATASSTGNTATTPVHSPITRRTNYLSFRAPHARPYIGGHYWYPDGCSVSERRRACTEIGDSVVKLLDTPAFGRFRKVLIGFSQGGYLSYRMVAEHPDVFDAAILLSPSFKGEAASEPPATRTRFALCYGTADHTIPAADQQCARAKLTATGNCTVFEYPGMAHAVCDQEIADLRAWLEL
ncbi:phospholipase/carboxylesterase [Bifidobacterium sp. DSM 109960]|uniref:Phospholipase/carboxylesterase n=1 Tax=Bifidobacterium erythrocebi TaxID=2675325 RepID=A0A7Y0HTU2_9BIFI|nr:dienelactone hydrolase family protein [Bifidobacterium sp. DSM 109960]NMM96570.1 phospholipase/carboxylesterase [Bifidobacterium sp. DSM 109960]